MRHYTEEDIRQMKEEFQTEAINFIISQMRWKSMLYDDEKKLTLTLKEKLNDESETTWKLTVSRTEVTH